MPTPSALAADRAGNRRAVAWAPVVAIAVFCALVATAGRYGPHRDELYFLAAGQHLAVAYPDQGPLAPLVARAMSELAPHSLIVLRLPSALAAALTILVAARMARDLGGGRAAETIAALCTAASSFVLFTGHLLSTSSFDLLAWTLALWLIVRIARGGSERLWLAVGAVFGVGLLNKPLPAFLAAGLLGAILLVGPRRLLRSPYLWGGAALAIAFWTPWLAWQSAHAWPQLTVARSLSAGHSASATSRWVIVPFQALLVSPPLAPVWIAGLVALVRDPRLRDVRFVAVAWLLLVVCFTVTGGKPYYLAGFLPALLASGAVAVEHWLAHARGRGRSALATVAVTSGLVVSAVIALPVLPVRDAGAAVALDGDVGETIGWPAYVRTVARVRHRLGPHAVVFTGNYGEAGAIDRYGPPLGLGPAWSGHNAYGLWGPPPRGARPVVVVGVRRPTLRREFTGCVEVARLDDGVGIDNEEQGRAVAVCRGPRGGWARAWPALRHLN